MTARRIHTNAAIVLSALSILLVVGAAAGQDKTLTVETIIDLKRVSSAAVDPTGTYAAYQLSVPREPDDGPGRGYSEIWVMPLDGGEARRFTPQRISSSSPQWSPDGRSIAFRSTRSDIDEKSQIYIVPIDGGEASAITDHETGVGSFRFSPDGTRIAFTARDAKTDEEKEADEDGRDWIIVDETFTCSRLWVLDFASGETTQVYEGRLHAQRFDWTPDGRTLLFIGSDKPDADTTMMFSRLYRVPAAGGEPQVVCPTTGKLGDFEVSPDGATLAFLAGTSLNDSLAQSVWIMPMDGEEARNITEGLEASISQLAWIDNETLLICASEGTRTTISELNASTGERRIVVDPGHSMSYFDLHRESGRICLPADTPSHPSELHVGSINDGPLTRLTDSNPHLAEYALGDQESIEWEAPDGDRIEGVITYPVGYEKGTRYPLIVNPHGGPEGADRVGFGSIAQMFASHGYLVFQPNYRGSAGRGVAWTSGDHRDLGGAEFEDLLAGVDHLIHGGLADPGRVGIGGWSYGGYFSALGATHHSHRFKAAMVGAGVTNWISFTGTTDIPEENAYTHWALPMYEHYEEYWKGSPMSGVQHAQTPTLIIHGQNDARVPVGQAHELYRALKAKGVSTQLVIYPRSGHGVGERAHRLDLYSRELEWFEKYLK